MRKPASFLSRASVSRLAVIPIIAAIGAPTSVGAAWPQLHGAQIASAGVLGELDGVAATSGGVIAVGTNSLYSTTPPCGQVFSEISTSSGWRVETAGNRAGRACAWRTSITADPRGGAWSVGYYIPSDGNPRTLIERYTGTTWSIVPSPAPGAKSVLTSVTVAPNHQVWAVGEYQTRGSGLQIGTFKTLTMVNSGSGWRIVSSPNLSPVDNELNSVAVSSTGRVWAVGFYQDTARFSDHTLTMAYGTSGWQIVRSPSPGNSTATSGDTLYSVTSSGNGGLWAVGRYTDSSNRLRTLTMSLRPNGWKVVPSPSPGSGATELRSVVAMPNGKAWAVGYFSGRSCGRTLTESFANGTWRIVHSPNPHCTTIRANGLNGVAVDRRGVVYAVGDTNITTLVLTNNGSGWHVAAS